MAMQANHTLYSIVLILTPTREASVRATVGHQAHAAFLRTVRESDPALNEELASGLTGLAQEIGAASDTVEVHIEGALDPSGGWTDPQENVRPAGVAIHFSFDIPLVGTEERELMTIFARGAAVAAQSVESLRSVFRMNGEE